MSLEVGTYISQLDTNNPLATDKKKQGDDHLRLIKTVLQGTFPNADRAMYFESVSVETTDFIVAAADENKTFLCDCSGGNIEMTLPDTAGLFDGWRCYFMKTDIGSTSAIYVLPNSGFVRSGEHTVARARRGVPSIKLSAVWTGSTWIIERATHLPIGTVLDCPRAALPLGYQYASGASLPSSTLFPEYFAAMGTLLLPDRRGLVAAALDNEGGVAAGRLSSHTVVGSIQGNRQVTLVTGNLPAYTPAGTIAIGTFAGTVNAGQNVATNGVVGPGSPYWGGDPVAVNFTGTMTFTGTPQGGTSTPVDKVQPTIATHMIVVVE